MVDILLYAQLRNREDEEPEARLGPFSDIDIFRNTIYGDQDDGRSFKLLHAADSKEEGVGIVNTPDGAIWKSDPVGLEDAVRCGFLKSGKVGSYYVIARIVSSDYAIPKVRAIKRRRVIVEKV